MVNIERIIKNNISEVENKQKKRGQKYEDLDTKRAI